MAMTRVVVDCSTGETRTENLSADVVAVRQAAAAASAQFRAAQDAKAAAQAAAVTQLKAKARGGDATSTLFLQAMGIDPNS